MNNDWINGEKEECYSMISQILDGNEYYIDQYEYESINSTSIRRMVRAISFFMPKCSRIISKRNLLWAENYVLLGEASIAIDADDLLEIAAGKLIDISLVGGGWGLPIDWHSGEYVFSKGTIMSTTTSEAILFLCACDKRNSTNKYKELVSTALNQMLLKLNKVSENGDMYSYTPLDKYVVINSNLLICAAILVASEQYQINDLQHKGLQLVKACLDSIPVDGGVTYFKGHDIVDAYHQLYCMRALFIISEFVNAANPYYKKTKDYFENTFIDCNNRVLVRTDRRILDLMATTEALRFYAYIHDCDKYHEIYKQMMNDFLIRGNCLSQRIWRFDSNLRISARNVFLRQGVARLLASIGGNKNVY